MLRQLIPIPTEPSPRPTQSGPRYWIESAVFLSLLLGLTALLLAGCEGANPQGRVPISGEVTLDGDPISEAIIIFSPTSAQGPAENVKAVAVVKEGAFALTQRDGPCPGNYDVLIQDQPPEFEAFAADVAQGTAPRRPSFTIPKSYGQPGRLTATVTEDGANQFQFALESRPGR
jgi:hypothetical protein